MNLIVEWANRNPVVVNVLVWPLITALLTWAFKPRTPEEYQRMGRVGSVLKVLGALGIDVPVLIQGLKEIRTGKHEPASTYVAARTIPPPAIVTTGLAEAVPKTTSDIPVTIEEPKDGAE